MAPPWIVLTDRYQSIDIIGIVSTRRFHEKRSFSTMEHRLGCKKREEIEWLVKIESKDKSNKDDSSCSHAKSQRSRWKWTRIKLKKEAVRLREGRERGSRFEVTCSVIFIGFRRWWTSCPWEAARVKKVIPLKDGRTWGDSFVPVRFIGNAGAQQSLLFFYFTGVHEQENPFLFYPETWRAWKATI